MEAGEGESEKGALAIGGEDIVGETVPGFAGSSSR
jgi:hypothetical protein